MADWTIPQRVVRPIYDPLEVFGGGHVANIRYLLREDPAEIVASLVSGNAVWDRWSP